MLRLRLVRAVGALALAGAAVFKATPGLGEDSDRPRLYLGVRYGDIVTGLTRPHDSAGAELGFNANGWLGGEFALDSYDLKVTGYDKAGQWQDGVSELSVLALVPQVRLRYPVWHKRLTPYVIAGVGMMISQPNDGRAPVQWPGGKTQVHPAGSLGGGIEYFLTDNFAFGLEAKYLLGGSVDYATQGVPTSIGLGAPIVTAAIRVFYPELHPEEDGREAAAADARIFAALRIGGARVIQGEPFGGIRAGPEQSIFGTDFSLLFGASIGATIGRYVSVDLTADGYESKLTLPGFGGIGEYAVFPFTVQPRFRYPLLDGRLEPYVLAGIGAEYAEINDIPDNADVLHIKARDIALVGDFGAGIEYFVMSSVSLGVETKYLISRGHTLRIGNEPSRQGNWDSLFLSIGIRVFLFDV